MTLNHSLETHKRLIARIPSVTGRDLVEWFKSLESGPAFLRCEERAHWLSDEHGLSQSLGQVGDQRRRLVGEVSDPSQRLLDVRVNLKRALPGDADSEYVAGFTDGWLAADGDPVKAASWRLRSTNHEALEWLEKAAPLAGYVVVGSGEESSRETNFGVRSRPIRWQSRLRTTARCSPRTASRRCR